MTAQNPQPGTPERMEAVKVRGLYQKRGYDAFIFPGTDLHGEVNCRRNYPGLVDEMEMRFNAFPSLEARIKELEGFVAKIAGARLAYGKTGDDAVLLLQKGV